jgi:phosphatidylserine/phosphatidylglycerophosphate/cardiolipin synthase-like enzyme
MFKSKYSSTAKISQLYDQDSFDTVFLNDIQHCRKSLLIESPFIRIKRVYALMPILSKLRKRGIHIVVNTRGPAEHDAEYQKQAEQSITMMQNMGIVILYTVKHHRKLAVIDRSTLWEGSLNILSYYDSCEIMRRTVSPIEAEILVNFIGMKKYLQDE